MSFSASSSRSTSPEAVETTQIFIKTIIGDTIPLTVPRDISIRNLITLLSLRTSHQEADLRLVYAGKHLVPSSTLETNHILRDSTIHLALPIRGGMPPKKVRCTANDCKQTAQRIVGDCGFCDGHFCEKHRLLEDHKCSGLEDCKKESHDRNAATLNKERTTVIRGI